MLNLFRLFASIFGQGANDSGEEPFISAVLFLREPQELTEQQVKDAMTRAWGQPYNGKMIVKGVPSKGILLSLFESVGYLLHNHAMRYNNDPNEIKAFATERERRIALEHKAWRSVDILRVDEALKEASLQVLWGRVCQLAAELGDSNCMGVYLADETQIFPWTEKTRAALKSTNPKWALRAVPREK